VVKSGQDIQLMVEKLNVDGAGDPKPKNL